jgi:foldase protein PrsA
LKTLVNLESSRQPSTRRSADGISSAFTDQSGNAHLVDGATKRRGEWNRTGDFCCKPGLTHFLPVPTTRAICRGRQPVGALSRFGRNSGSEKKAMSAGTHATAQNVDAKPRRRVIWIFGGAATAVVAGGLLMQYFRAPSGQAATEGPAGTARIGAKRTPEFLAKVGKETISYDAVAEECVNRHGKEVLEDLIHRLIIQQACEEQNLTVTEQEVSEEISRVAKRFNLDVKEYLEVLQSERNITPMQYRTSVIWPMLALKKLAGEDVDITEEDLQQAFVRGYGPRVKARVIMMENPRQANDVWEKAKRNPEDFDKLAQKYSIDPNSRALGGQIPPIPRFTGNEKLEQEAFRLKAGEISGVIQLSTGRHIILKCEGQTEPVVKNIEEVRDRLYDELKEAKTQQAVGKMFEKIRQKTRVDNYLTMTTSGPDRAPPGTSPGSIQPVSATQQLPPQQQPASSQPARSANAGPPTRTAR